VLTSQAHAVPRARRYFEFIV
jgi:hypothetical protein